MYKSVLSTEVAYILDLDTIMNQVFINIFQTKHVLAVRFPLGYEKNIQLSFDTKISRRLGEKKTSKGFKNISKSYKKK